MARRLHEYTCSPSQKMITKPELDELERYLDKVWEKVGVDIEFTRHFLERVNDARNGRQITLCELQDLFLKTFRKYGKALAKFDGKAWEAVLNSISTQINMPFVLTWNNRDRQLELIAKTIMRKKNFMTPDKKLTVESTSFGAVTNTNPELQGVLDAQSSPLDLDDPMVVRNLNAMLAQVGNKKYINPYYPVHAVWVKLSLIGISFPIKEVLFEADRGVLYLPISQWGEQTGSDYDSMWISDDRFDDAFSMIPDELQMRITYQEEDGLFEVRMKIVTPDNDEVELEGDGSIKESNFIEDATDSFLFHVNGLTEAPKTDQEWRELISKYTERQATFGDKIDLWTNKLRHTQNSLAVLMKEIQMRRRAGKKADSLIERHKKALERINSWGKRIDDARQKAKLASKRTAAVVARYSQWKRNQSNPKRKATR